jgi:2-deoxy-D-gluconate 3-dehydrogenase
MFSLRGKVAAVTGARSGIGRAIAAAFAAAGAELVLVGRGDQSDTAAWAPEARLVIADLAEAEQVDRAADALAGVDILVNNAGMITRGGVLGTSMSDWRQTLSVNLDAAFALSQRVAGPMAERGSGKIINIASVLSFQGGIRVPAYTASKHAIVGMTRAFANELAPRGVQVNAIAPGYVRTDNTIPLQEDAERSDAIVARIPAGRWGEPADIAGAAVFLASPASDYVTGTVLAVDGGWLSR